MEEYLIHHGIKGQRWGIRRFQNEDGSLTSEGVKRYQTAKGEYKQAKRDYDKSFNDAYKYSNRHPIGQVFNKDMKKESEEKWGDVYDKAAAYNRAHKEYKDAKKEYRHTPEHRANVARAAKIGAGLAAGALASYGVYKASQLLRIKAKDKIIERGMVDVKRWENYGYSLVDEGLKYDLGSRTRDVLLKNSSAAFKMGDKLKAETLGQAQKAYKSTPEAIKYLYKTRKL